MLETHVQMGDKPDLTRTKSANLDAFCPAGVGERFGRGACLCNFKKDKIGLGLRH